MTTSNSTVDDFYTQWLGVPAGPRPPDHYSLLGLTWFEKDLDLIRAAAKKQSQAVRARCLKYPEIGTELLNQIARARVCLLDPQRKTQYDHTLTMAPSEFPTALPVVLPQATPIEAATPAVTPSFGAEAGSAALAKIKEVLAYYWDGREHFWRRAQDYFAGTMPDSTMIRLEAGRDYHTASCLETGWEVYLPDRCAVCGAPAPHDAELETHAVPDVTGPLWSLVISFGIGIMLGIGMRAWWPLPFSLMIGLGVGYGLRRQFPAQIHCRRCAEHSARKDLPKLCGHKDVLLIRVGNAAVVREFRRNNRPVRSSRKERRTKKRDSDAAEHVPIPVAGNEERHDAFAIADNVIVDINRFSQAANQVILPSFAEESPAASDSETLQSDVYGFAEPLPRAAPAATKDLLTEARSINDTLGTKWKQLEITVRPCEFCGLRLPTDAKGADAILTRFAKPVGTLFFNERAPATFVVNMLMAYFKLHSSILPHEDMRRNLPFLLAVMRLFPCKHCSRQLCPVCCERPHAPERCLMCGPSR